MTGSKQEVAAVYMQEKGYGSGNSGVGGSIPESLLVQTTKTNAQTDFKKFKAWAANSLDLYKPELQQLVYPLFLHIYLDLLHHPTANPSHFLDLHKADPLFHPQHSSQIIKLAALSETSDLAEWRKHKYWCEMSELVFRLLIGYLHDNEFTALLRILNDCIDVHVKNSKPTPANPPLISDTSGPALDPSPYNSTPVSIGLLPTDPLLIKELDRHMKLDSLSPEEIHLISRDLETMRKPVDDTPIDPVPLAPMKLLDIDREIKELAELRDKLKVAAGGSVCCFTLFNTYQSLTCATLSPTATHIVTGYEDSFIRIWDIRNDTTPPLEQKPTPEPPRPTKLIGHSGPVTAVSLKNEEYIVSSSEDSTIRLWSTTTRSCVAVYKTACLHWDVEFSPVRNSTYFAGGGRDACARVWGLDDTRVLRVFVGHLEDVNTVTFHPNNNYLLTGSEDKTARLWDIQKGTCVRLFSRHNAGVYCLDVSPDGKLCATSGEDKTIIIWDIASGKPIKKFNGHDAMVTSLSFSNDSRKLVSGSLDCSVRVWDCGVGEEEETDKAKDGGGLIECFYTKKSTVYQVKYARNGMAFAVSCYNE